MTGIEVMLGSDHGRCVFLSWRGAGGDAASTHEALQASRSSRRWGRNVEMRQELDWDSLAPQHSTMYGSAQTLRESQFFHHLSQM